MEDLAARVGVSWQTIQQWENGKTAPKRTRLIAVAQALQTTPEYLAVGTGEAATRTTGDNSGGSNFPFPVTDYDLLTDAQKRTLQDVIRSYIASCVALTRQNDDTVVYEDEDLSQVSTQMDIIQDTLHQDQKEVDAPAGIRRESTGSPGEATRKKRGAT